MTLTAFWELAAAAGYGVLAGQLLWFVRRRPDLEARWIPASFSAFLLACGVRHALAATAVRVLPAGPLLPAAVALSLGAVIVAGLRFLPRLATLPGPEAVDRLRTELDAESRLRRRVEEGRRTADMQLDVLLAVGYAANGAAGLDEALQAGLDLVCRHAGWPLGHASLRREQGGEAFLVPSGVWHAPEGAAPRLAEASVGLRFRRGEGLPGRVWRTGQAYTVPDLEAFGELPQLPLLRELGARCGFGFPLLVGTEVAGVLEFYGPDPAVLDLDFLELVAGVGVQLGRVLERDEARRRLLESAERLEALTRSAHDAIVTLDAAGCVVGWNPAAEAILGYAAAELLGRPAEAAVPPEARPAYRAAFEAVVAGRTPLLSGQAEMELLRKDGGRVLVELSVGAWSTAEGRFFTGIVRDVTQRRRAEERVRETEERFRLLVEGVRDYAIFMLDTEGRVVSWNAGAERINGYRAEEILGRHYGCFFPPEELAQGGPRRELEEAVARGSFEHEGWRLRKDGSRFYVNVVLTALKDEEGRLRGFAKVTRDVTARRQAQVHLQESEERFRRLSEATSEGIVIHDGEVVLDANEAMAHMFGYPAEEMAGLSVYQLIPPEWRELVARMTRTGHTASYACVGLRRDGGRFHIEVRGRTIPYQGKARRVALIRDVTEAHEAEIQLRRTLTALEHAVEGISYVDAEGNFASANQAFQRIVGVRAQELLGRPWYGCVHRDDRPRLDALLTRMDREGKAVAEVRGAREGAASHLELTLVGSYGEDARFLGFHVLLKDISERKEAETLLRGREAQLEEAMRIGRMGSWEWSIPANEVRWSEELCRIHGVAPGAFPRDYDGFMALVAPEDREPLRAAVARTLETLEPMELDFRAFTPAGEERTLHTRAVVQADEEGGPQRLFGVTQDVTELRTHEAHLRFLAEELLKRNRDLEDFATVASHDLQEPLRKVQILGDRLRVKLPKGQAEDALDYLDRMQKAAGRMQLLIQDVLALSRISTHGKAFQPVDLQEVVEDVLSDTFVVLDGLDHQVEVAGLPTVEGDPIQLRQLFQNLIGNARKYRRPEVASRIRVWSEEEGGRARIRVADNGIGMDPRFLEKIFEPFHRLHGRSEFEGTGIGLAICRKIAERHGGKIWAESAPGEGSTFIVELPLRPPFAGTR